MIQNKDVPDTAIIRQLIKENEQLKKEINRLNDALILKNRAIADFKVWQSKIALYKYKYWLAEGLKLANESVDMKQVETLRRFFAHHSTYSRWLKKCTNAMEQIAKDGEKLKDCVKEG